MTLYLLLAVVLLGAIAPSFAAPGSPARSLRFLFVLAVYPLFFAIGFVHGAKHAALVWLGLAGLSFLLELAADKVLSPKDPTASLLKSAGLTVLLWPLALIGAIEALLIHAGLAPEPLPVTLPEPPRGEELFSLSDDELLVAAHQILAGRPELTETERTLWLAETFSREFHSGGLAQWFSANESPAHDTVQALRAVGAGETAGILVRASEAPNSVSALTDRLFRVEFREDLTQLNARFARHNRLRCPSLNGKDPEDG